MRRIQGIRTLYSGVQFRSRLEATWAAFFDGLKISWDYEPTDLAGYIPDFDLRFTKRPLLIEVKPLEEDFAIAKSKVECSGWEGDIAIVVSGATPDFGVLYEAGIGWDRCCLAWCLGCRSHTLASESGRWTCRNCGAGSREFLWGMKTADAWALAKNATQWRRAG